MRTLILLVLLAGCPGTIPGPNVYKPYAVDPRVAEIQLGVGDVLAINVWDNKDLTTDAIVRADGTITMPLVGDLKAAGETPSSLKAKIKTALQNFISKVQSTEITVAVKSWHSYRYTIQGEVTRSGNFNSDQYVTIIEALAQAGGLTRFAKRDGIKLFRKDNTGKQIVIPFNYDALNSGDYPYMNIWILPGDTIYVP